MKLIEQYPPLPHVKHRKEAKPRWARPSINRLTTYSKISRKARLEQVTDARLGG